MICLFLTIYIDNMYLKQYCPLDSANLFKFACIERTNNKISPSPSFRDLGILRKYNTKDFRIIKNCIILLSLYFHIIYSF